MTQPADPPRPPDGMRFNAPPGWPPAPPGWAPPADFQPDPSWPAAPPDWQYWAPISEATAVMAQPTAVFSPPDAVHGPVYTQPMTSQQPGSGPLDPGPGDPPKSWLARHRLLAVAIVVVALMALGGIGYAGVRLVNNNDDGKPSTPAAKSADPQPSGASPSAQPSPEGSGVPTSPENAAACQKAADPHKKAVALLSGLRAKTVTDDAAIAAIPSIQADLKAAGEAASGVLATDLKEYATALGELRTALMQDTDPTASEAQILIYGIVLKAACNY